jgi:predicted SnoaL-like aldol condensation-catalyzing enzyme
MKDQSRKDIAIEIIVQGVSKQDKSVINKWVKADYIQHNPIVPDGRKGVLILVEKIINGEIPAPEITVKRALADGEYVILHSDFNWGGKKAVFEIFRFEDGLAAEHWSGIQDQPQQTANGHTMVDGPTEIKDRDKTETNKALIKEFMETIFLQGQFDKMNNFFQGDHYIQHNPMLADGVSGLFKGLEAMQQKGITVEFQQVHQILGEGNFVLALSEGKFNGKATAFYDLFRLESGKIAEHWDVLQEVPATMAHGNGMF